MAAVETASMRQDASPSPTLTNPDMILPYNMISLTAPRTPERNLRSPLASSSPLGHSVISLLSTSENSSMNTSTEEINAHLGVATAVQMPIRAKPTSVLGPFAGFETATGYEHGAPLSDIGEEEMTPRSRMSRRSKSPSPVQRFSIPDTPTGPTTSHKRHSSDQMSDDESEIGDWETFDTSKMMTGRLAADVANDDDDENDGAESKRNSVITISNEDKDEMAILNDKAEKILASARKRLTHMEDNLSKARHSVLWSPRSSPNMNISDVQQPVGGLYRSISLAGTGRRLKPLNLVLKNSPAHARGSSDTTSGLKRLSMIPEARASSAQEYTSRMESPQQYSKPIISSRLNGHSPASSRSVNSPMGILEEETTETESPSTVKTSPENNAVHGLGINTFANRTKEDLFTIPEQPSPTNLVRSASASSANRPASAASARSLREQMSDLQLRIANLKSKTQVDKERRGSGQLRNTPSPFTNSSNPEQWYTNAPGFAEGESPLNTNAGQGWSPRHNKSMSLDAQMTPITPQTATFLNTEPPTTADSVRRDDARTDVNTPSLHQKTFNAIPQVENADSLIDESHYEDAIVEFEADEDQVAASEEEQIYLNEVLEESLHDVEPEVPDIPDQYFGLDPGEAERHEDRLDAFDYENMFLHSAMGNFAHDAGSRGSSTGSDASSVDTERAFQGDSKDEYEDGAEQDDDEGYAEEEERLVERDLETPVPGQIRDGSGKSPKTKGLTPSSKPWMNDRSQSALSVSTVQSFATATEGRDDDDSIEDDDEEEEVPHDILNWGGSNMPIPSSPETMAGAFPPPPRTRIASPVKAIRTPLRSPIGSPIRVRRQNSPDSPPHLRVVTGNAFAANGIPAPHSRSVSTEKVPGNHSRSLSDVEPSEMMMPSPSSQLLPDSRTMTPVQSPSQSQSQSQRTSVVPDHPANTEILMESLIKLADPDFCVPSPIARSVSSVPSSNSASGRQSSASRLSGGSPSASSSNAAVAAPGQMRTGVFADVDKELVLTLLRAVGGVCNGVLVAEKRRETREVKVLRRRLDLARQVLEGMGGLGEE